MRTNPTFYFHYARNTSEMQKYEDVLLNLATQCLKRQINLIPFLEEDEAATFKPQAKTWTKLALARPQLNLLVLRLTLDNFFLSVFKQNWSLSKVENI